MTFKAIPGLLYNGVQVGYDDNSVDIPSQPPGPVPQPSVATTYPIQMITLSDAMFLYKMDGAYRTALKNLPGAHQLSFDILTSGGKTYWQMVGAQQQAMQTQVNRVINLAGSDNAALTNAFDVKSYFGPLKQIYQNLVQAKLAGRT